MTTRAKFIQRVRHEMARSRGLFSAKTAERPADPVAVVETIRRQLAERWPEALEKFREEFERVGGVFYRVRLMDDVPALIGSIAREREAHRIVTWGSSALGPALGAGLRAEGLDVTEEAGEAPEGEARARFREASAQAEVGVTAVDLAVAETGSLVVISGAGKARSVSLLPPYHVAVFGKTALVETLEQVGVIFEALHQDPDGNRLGAAINFITGPSRTADIELTLTRGVHGPKEVHAIFVESL
ncbi:MAG: lactate utilization protein [Candidatus Rokubacteria bacterium]|nr:lactate utilization protein [Candidatus Rokubacteria bacterium]